MSKLQDVLTVVIKRKADFKKNNHSIVERKVFFIYPLRYIVKIVSKPKLKQIYIYKTLTSVPSHRHGGGVAIKMAKNMAEVGGLPLKNLLA